MIKHLLGSKKAWMVPIGVLLMYLGDAFGVSTAVIENTVWLVIAYIGGQGAVDVMKELRQPKPGTQNNVSPP